MANHPNRSTNKIRAVQKRLQPAFSAIMDSGGQCMEQVLDRENGILTERWLMPNGTSLIVYGTPLFCDVFVSISGGASWQDTIDGIKRAAALASSAKP